MWRISRINKTTNCAEKETNKLFSLRIFNTICDNNDSFKRQSGLDINRHTYVTNISGAFSATKIPITKYGAKLAHLAHK